MFAYGAGLGIGLAPLAAHVARIGTERAWRTLFVETVLLAGPGRRLPIPPHGLLAATLFGAAMLAAVALLLLAARMAAAQPMSPRVRGWLALAALSLGVLPQLLQRADSLHAIDAACVSLPLCPIAALRARRPLRAPSPSRARARGRRRRCRSGGAGLAAALSGARWLEQGGRRFPLPPALAANLAPVLREIDRRAAPGDTLFVGPRDLRRTNYGDTFVYFMLPHLRPASYYTEMNPGVANAAGSSLARDIERADFLILTDRFDDWNEPNASSRLGPAAPLRVVEGRFCRLMRSGHFELRERCDRRAERVQSPLARQPDRLYPGTHEQPRALGCLSWSSVCFWGAAMIRATATAARDGRRGGRGGAGGGAAGTGGGAAVAAAAAAAAAAAVAAAAAADRPPRTARPASRA